MRHRYDQLNHTGDTSLYPSQQEVDEIFSNWKGATSENWMFLPLELQEENIRSIPMLSDTDSNLLKYEELFSVLRNPDGRNKNNHNAFTHCNSTPSRQDTHSVLKETNLRRPVSSEIPDLIRFPLYASLNRSTSELTSSLRKNFNSMHLPILPTSNRTRNLEDTNFLLDNKTEFSSDFENFSDFKFESPVQMHSIKPESDLHCFLLNNFRSDCALDTGHISQETFEDNGGNAPHYRNKMKKYKQQGISEMQSRYDKGSPQQQVSFSLNTNEERLKHSKHTKMGNGKNTKLNEKLKGEKNARSKISNTNGKKALLRSNKKSNVGKLSSKINKKLVRCLGCARKLRIHQHVELVCCPVCRVITPSQFNEIAVDSSVEIKN